MSLKTATRSATEKLVAVLLLSVLVLGCDNANPDEAVNPILPWLPPAEGGAPVELNRELGTLLRADMVVLARGFRTGPSRFNTYDTGPDLKFGTHRSLTGSTDDCLLGPCPDELTWEFYCAYPDGEQDPSCDAVREVVASREQPVVLILTRANGDHLYLADRYHGTALLPAEGLPEVRSRLQGLQDADARFEALPRERLDRAVTEQLQRITNSPREQYDALRALLRLGTDAIPAIARHLDDQRPLPRAYVMLENSPEFWEAHAQYGPVTVMDALSIILTRLAGVSLCNNLRTATEDRPTAEVRERCALRWRRFAVLATEG